MIGDASSSTEDRKATAQKVKEQARSFTVLDGIIETLDSDLSFPNLREAAAALPRKTKAERPRAIHDAMLYRSAMHSVASGVFCHTLAIRGRHRALYEGARLFHILKPKT